MIQDIAPHKFHVEFYNYAPQASDYVLAFFKGQLLLRKQDTIDFLCLSECPAMCAEKMVYLFSIDELRFFYWQLDEDGLEGFLQRGFRLANRRDFRTLTPKHLAFAAVTACMLDGWYSSNRYCGRCGKKLIHDGKERMMRCLDCDNRIYPRINPAVIVAVTSEGKLLLTKYRGREYKNYALVAGFTEVGESFEDTVRREVKEEAGLSVKNIRYFGSQPWAFADNILAGYICEVDGSEEIKMDEEELSCACWISRDEISVEYTDSSLTNEMICAFKNKKY
ncbi:MAG: NAD(+) diphosphatase [Lachnospiraceae bacterium]|nr:NAD(+) diphosphatase [Lachnospiraceae bacterium]